MTIDQQTLGVTPMDIINTLAEENIEARLVWKPLHLQPVFNGVTYYPHQEGWSVSDELFANRIGLSSGSNMTVEEKNRVIEVFIKAIKR